MRRSEADSALMGEANSESSRCGRPSKRRSPVNVYSDGAEGEDEGIRCAAGPRGVAQHRCVA